MTEPPTPSEKKGHTAADKLKAAEVVCDELKAALRDVGIVLPSLWVEPSGYVASDLRPLIQLGRCNLDTARKILDVFQKAQP